MARCVMVQGTMSNVGKSLLVTALCRIFKQDGLRTAPFKSQNMALNSYVTPKGLELSRAQAVQAWAAGLEPDVRMNPILLKPSSDTGSQLIVNGRLRGHCQAADYFSMKRDLIPDVLSAYNRLAEEFDVIVIEGAGSPVEINLPADPFVNMGLARLVNAPVLLAGDIDRGGVFAQLCGTVALLGEDRRYLAGTVINKFRGDVSLLRPGLGRLEELTGVPVLGVIPYAKVDIDDEDSLSTRFESGTAARLVDIAVVRLPRISNFTDFSPLGCYENVSLRYVTSPRELGAPDLIILPGTKSTIEDLRWLRQSGLEAALLKAASARTPLLGVCGGYQMLGRTISDPDGAEAAAGTEIAGLGLLDLETVFQGQKVQTQVQGAFEGVEGFLAPLTGLRYEGYEIHMGRSGAPRPALMCQGNVYGTYIHGLFDASGVADALLRALCAYRGKSPDLLNSFDPAVYREKQYDLLAAAVRENLDMEAIYRIMG